MEQQDPARLALLLLDPPLNQTEIQSWMATVDPSVQPSCGVSTRFAPKGRLQVIPA